LEQVQFSNYLFLRDAITCLFAPKTEFVKLEGLT